MAMRVATLSLMDARIRVLFDRIFQPYWYQGGLSHDNRLRLLAAIFIVNPKLHRHREELAVYLTHWIWNFSHQFSITGSPLNIVNEMCEKFWNPVPRGHRTRVPRTEWVQTIQGLLCLLVEHRTFISNPDETKWFTIDTALRFRKGGNPRLLMYDVKKRVRKDVSCVLIPDLAEIVVAFLVD
jgi:hypothetical protein